VRLYGVGVGPGDPELLTLKALRVIKEADVILIPRTSKGLTRSVVGDLVKDKEVVEFDLPLRGDRRIYQEVLRSVENYDKVIYLTLGDPSIYSSFYYAARLVTPVEVIPGITSFSWCAALHKLPLIQGAETMAVAPVSRVSDVKADVVIAMKGELEGTVKCGSGYFTVNILRRS
jgi:precorrin-2/cobalt-factor-2 C20-methyltransferase